MKKIVLLLFLNIIAIGAAMAQTSGKTFSFSYYMKLMQYGDKGQPMDSYRKHAADLGLKLLSHTEEKSELYMVWGQDISYEKVYMSETYKANGGHPRCLNLDLTPNGKDRYTPISVTLVFSDKASWQTFWNEGEKFGCRQIATVVPTDIDPSWSEVRGLTYNANPKTQKSWRYVYFYRKDGLYMCTYLF